MVVHDQRQNRVVHIVSVIVAVALAALVVLVVSFVVDALIHKRPERLQLTNVRSGQIANTDGAYETLKRLTPVQMSNETLDHYGGFLEGNDLKKVQRQFPQLGSVDAAKEGVFWFHGFRPLTVASILSDGRTEVKMFETKDDFIYFLSVSMKDRFYTERIVQWLVEAPTTENATAP